MVDDIACDIVPFNLRGYKEASLLEIHSTCSSSLPRSNLYTMPTEIAQAQIHRAHYVRDHGHTARPGCSTCIALVCPCILPASDARKLHKCFQCTLSRQKCSIDRLLNKENYEDQILTPRSDFTEDTSSDSDTWSNSDASIWNGIPSDEPSIENKNAPSIEINTSAALAALDKTILSLDRST